MRDADVAEMVKCHIDGDHDGFCAAALRIADKAHSRGHLRVAADVRALAEVSPAVRETPTVPAALVGLVDVSEPRAPLRSLVLADQQHRMIGRLIEEQQRRDVLLAAGYEPAGRVLLAGPPGTGKTATASAVACELGLRLWTVRLDGIVSKFLGETAARLRVLFDAAAAERAVYFFDEFDALGAERSDSDVGEARRILASILAHLERDLPGSVVIAATNRPEILDRALTRRFDVTIPYALPDPDAAREVMRRRLAGRIGYAVAWDDLRADTTGLSHADLVAACEAAAKHVIVGDAERLDAAGVDAAVADRQRRRLVAAGVATGPSWGL